MGSLLRLIRLSGVVLGCGGIPHVRFLYYHLIGRVIRKSPALSKTKISLLFIQVVTPISPKSSGLSPRCFIFEFFNLFFSIKAMTPARCLLRGAVLWVLYYILSCHPPALHSSKCSEISEISDLAHEEHIYIMYYSI